jgi:hypothetical protein
MFIVCCSSSVRPVVLRFQMHGTEDGVKNCATCALMRNAPPSATCSTGFAYYRSAQSLSLYLDWYKKDAVVNKLVLREFGEPIAVFVVC